MFYWKNKTANDKTLIEEMMSADAVSSVQIATAFLSQAGVDVLRQLADKYGLSPDKTILYLSPKFSSDNPGDLLDEVSKLCSVKILFEDSFHPKVYLLRGSEVKLIYGSSNFTNGGLFKNIEFDYVGTPNQDELSQVSAFFDFCERKATSVNDEIIGYYKSIQGDVRELSRNQRTLTSLLTGFMKKDDAFAPDDYDINDYYFNFNDYETFFSRNAKKADSEIRKKRESVQKKMLSIHENVFPSIRKLGIFHHKRKDNITSLIIPHVVNKYTIGWIGVRYGKTPDEVDVLNINKEKDDDVYGFQKHGCLQFSIHSNGFEISFFLAVRNGAIDRMWLNENGFKRLKEKRNKIEAELSKLKGHGFVWTVWNDGEPIEFHLDSQPVESFCDWFMENDMDGRESLLSKFYQPDEDVISTHDSIGVEIERIMTMLLPLYNTMVWRIKTK